MFKESLHEPFSIAHRVLDECPKPAHRHNFFELVYIIQGEGRQCINQNSFNYRPGHLFLITPEDCHSFEVKNTTTFFFLRFHDIYIKNSGLLAENVERLEYILHHANHQPGCILKHQPDKALVSALIEGILREMNGKEVFGRELIQQLVNTLIVVVARNIARYLPASLETESDDKALAIVQYIQHHIFQPDKIRTETIGAHFGISEKYLGKYFKRHTQETLQQFITRYKMRLIEHRLQFSDKRINEIADEFGFSDESHLNKYFRKQQGRSPGEFRRSFRHTGTAATV